MKAPPRQNSINGSCGALLDAQIRRQFAVARLLALKRSAHGIVGAPPRKLVTWSARQRRDGRQERGRGTEPLLLDIRVLPGRPRFVRCSAVRAPGSPSGGVCNRRRLRMHASCVHGRCGALALRRTGQDCRRRACADGCERPCRCGGRGRGWPPSRRKVPGPSGGDCGGGRDAASEWKHARTHGEIPRSFCGLEPCRTTLRSPATSSCSVRPSGRSHQTSKLRGPRVFLSPHRRRARCRLGRLRWAA